MQWIPESSNLQGFPQEVEVRELISNDGSSLLQFVFFAKLHG